MKDTRKKINKNKKTYLYNKSITKKQVQKFNNQQMKSLKKLIKNLYSI